MTAEKKKKKPAISALRLEGDINIYHAVALKQLLLAPLAQPCTLEVNLSGVTELDSAGLQLLMLAKRTAQARQCELRLTGHSPAVLEVFELLNLAAYFGDPLVISPVAGARS